MANRLVIDERLQKGMTGFGMPRDVKGKHLKRIWELEFPEEAIPDQQIVEPMQWNLFFIFKCFYTIWICYSYVYLRSQILSTKTFLKFPFAILTF